MSKRIRLEVGSFDGENKLSEDKKYLDKSVMLVYSGDFESMDGPVQIKDEDIETLASNHNSFLSKLSRMATGEVPLRHNPPLQLDHSTSAKDTVGRLIGELTIGEHTTDDGQKRKALMGTARVLGADNIEKVMDGRWAHVSIGADLENHKITELSITPFPAAADASLLSKANLAKKTIKETTYKGKKITIKEDEDAIYAFVGSKDLTVSGFGSVADAVSAAKEYIDDPGSRSDLSRMGKYSVVLPDGSDWDVSAEDEQEALEKAKAGKGKKVGQYPDYKGKTKVEKLSAKVQLGWSGGKIHSQNGKDVYSWMRDGQEDRIMITVEDQETDETLFEKELSGSEAKSLKTKEQVLQWLKSKYKLTRMATPGEEVHEEGEYKDCIYTIYEDANGRIVWEAVEHSGIVHSVSQARTDAKKAIDNFIKNNPQLSKGDEEMGYKEMKEKMSLYEKCKKHLMEEKKMSEEDADKHLEEAKDDDLTAMAAQEDERMSKLAEEEVKAKDAEMARMSKLKEQKTQLIALRKEMNGMAGKVQLAQKKMKISSRLSKLLAEQKVTPAEVKKINLSQMAEKSDEAIDAALLSYEQRQPVIEVGLRGSVKALTPSQVQSQIKKLSQPIKELKTRLSMPSKRDAALAQLKEMGLKEADLEEPVQIHIDNVPQGQHDVSGMDEKFEAAYAKAKQLMAEGKEEEAKEHLKAHCKTLTMEPELAAGPESHAEMSALAQEYSSLQTKFNEFVNLAAPAFGATDEELK